LIPSSSVLTRPNPHPINRSSDTASDNGLLDDAEQGSGGWAGLARNQLPPMWVDVVENIEEKTRQIQLKMRELAALHTKRLMVTFDDSNDAEQDREIQALTHHITDLFRHANKSLASIGRQAKTSESEDRVRQNIQRSLALKLQQLSSSFRGSQKEYMQRLKAQKEGGSVAAGGFDFLASGEGKGDGVGDTGFNPMQQVALEDTEALVRERDEEIRNIAESISELGAIFKELAVLVIDQGTILDRIDFNMEQVVEHTKEGVVQLEQAEDYQKSARPIKCIILQLLIIAILVIVLATRNQDKNS